MSEQLGNCSLGGYDDDAHVKACSAGAKCARCTWVKYKPVWQKELAWLDAKMNMESGSWGLGCRLCHDAQEVSPEAMSKFPVSRHHFARYEVNSGDIRVARFRKHAASPAHRTAESMAGGKAPALEEIGGFSPTMSEWKSVISHSKPGHCQADVDDAGNRKKAHMMRWCLAEAHRQKQREAIQTALCVSLAQDQRGRRFLVRFRAVDAKLAVCYGTLQLVKVVASPNAPGAQGIRQMTLKALQNFCTPSLPPTYGGLLPGAKEEKPCDNDLLQALMGKVECIAADAAGDEQLAMRDLAGISGPDIVELQDVMGQSFQNLKARGAIAFLCGVDINDFGFPWIPSGSWQRPRSRSAKNVEPPMGS